MPGFFMDVVGATADGMFLTPSSTAIHGGVPVAIGLYLVRARARQAGRS